MPLSRSASLNGLPPLPPPPPRPPPPLAPLAPPLAPPRGMAANPPLGNPPLPPRNPPLHTPSMDPHKSLILDAHVCMPMCACTHVLATYVLKQDRQTARARKEKKRPEPAATEAASKPTAASAPKPSSTDTSDCHPVARGRLPATLAPSSAATVKSHTRMHLFASAALRRPLRERRFKTTYLLYASETTYLLCPFTRAVCPTRFMVMVYGLGFRPFAHTAP